LVLGSTVKIASSETDILLSSPDEDEEVRLRPRAGGSALRDEKELLLTGRSYQSQSEAAHSARRWQGLLQKAFARVNIGADFGSRAPEGGLTKHGKKLFEGSSGRRVLDDVHGILVFECEPSNTVFARANPVGVVMGVQADRLAAALTAARELGAVMTDHEELAYDLYSASFSEPSADARFITLMMAVETLIDPHPRPLPVRAYVEMLITQTEAADLPKEEIESILGTLNGLRDESVGQAGRRLASQLGDRTYMDEAPGKFFAKCYMTRSRLVHGNAPLPPRAAVAKQAASLERFVADLLSLELLE
jgi:hypothetical protein